MDLTFVGYICGCCAGVFLAALIISACLYFFTETEIGKEIAAFTFLYMIGIMVFALATLLIGTMWMWQYISLIIIGGLIPCGYLIAIAELDNVGWKLL